RGVSFTTGAHGKPGITGSSLAFSLSHVEGLALIAVDAEGEVGVDLERVRPIRMGQPRRGQIEVAGAQVAPPPLSREEADARFLQAWVRLEALAKFDGCGIGHMLTRLGITRSGKRGERPAAVLESAGAEVHDVDLGPGVFAAIALAKGRSMPALNWLPTS